MIDVFIRVWARSALRLGLATAVIERIRVESGIRRTLLIAEPSLCDPSWGTYEAVVTIADPLDFHRRSKAVADELARGEAYVVLDDDHLPVGRDWLAAGLAALRERSDYGYVSSWSVNGEVPAAGDDPLVFPALSGTPYFMRRPTYTYGFLGALPDGPLESYDTIFAEHVQALGWQTGFARQVRHNHLGMGYSQIIPGHWGAPA